MEPLPRTAQSEDELLNEAVSLLDAEFAPLPRIDGDTDNTVSEQCEPVTGKTVKEQRDRA